MPVIPGILASLDPITQSGIGPLVGRLLAGTTVAATLSVPEVSTALYYAAESAVQATSLPAGTYSLACYSAAGSLVTDPQAYVWDGQHEIDPVASAVLATPGNPIATTASGDVTANLSAAAVTALWSDSTGYPTGSKGAIVAALYTLLQTVSATDAQTLSDAAAELSTGSTAIQLAAVASNVSTLLSRLAQAVSFDGSGNVRSTPQTPVTVGANNDKAGYSATATNLPAKYPATLAAADVAGNLPAQVGGYAAGQDPPSLLLATPANKLATDSSGRTTSANPAVQRAVTIVPSS